MRKAKIQILSNFIDAKMNSYIPNFVPYKSRLELNIPLLQNNIRSHLYSLLDQFYELNENGEYFVINEQLASHEDVNKLVLKISTIVSNKLLGKNVVGNFIEESAKKCKHTPQEQETQIPNGITFLDFF